MSNIPAPPPVSPLLWRTGALIAFVGVLVVLIAGAVLGFVNARQLAEQQQLVSNAREIEARLERLLSTLKDGETGQRGYLLTDEERYLVPYEQAIASVDAQVAELKTMIAGNREQQARFASVERDVAAKVAEMSETVKLAAAGDLTGALAVIRSNLGTDLMDSLRASIADMINDERANLDARLEGARDSFRATLLAVVLPSLIAGTLLVFVFVLFRRHDRDRQRNADAITAERERLRVTLASIGDAVLATDENANVTFVNGVAESLTGWTAAEAQGVPLDRVFVIVDEETREPVENPAMRALREGMTAGLTDHAVLVAKDGSERPIDDSAAPIRVGESVVGAILVFRDVTERRRADRELRRARDELEQRVRERTAELLRANRFMEALLDNVEEGIVACDADGVLTLFNRATRQMHGLPEEALPAERWAEHYDLFRADGTTPMAMDEVPLFRALAGDNVREAEMVIAAKGQEPRTVLASGQAFHDDEGQLLGAVVSMHDVTLRRRAEVALRAMNAELEARVLRRTDQLQKTNMALEDEIVERARAEEERNKFHTLAEISTDFIGICGVDGKLFYLNPAAVALVGLESREQGYAKTLDDFLFPEDRKDVRDDFLRDVLTKGDGEIEIRFRHFKSGAAMWMLFKVFALNDERGERIGLATVSREITRRRELEDDLRRMSSELSEADRRKDEFLATLAHELRNPLAPMRNGLHILRLMEGGPNLNQVREMMERQLAQMVRLVDDLLDVSRITRDKLELRREAVPLARVLESALETSRPLIESSGHTLDVRMPPPSIHVDADTTRLAQVFSNLLNNAAKYTERGGRIGVDVALEGSQVVITVSDTGLGIPPAMLARVFDIFAQVDRTLERAQGGLGIGLTLVKRLVEMHGGTVEAQSEGERRGSRFIVRLPVVASTTDARTDGSVPPGGERSKRRVLVVDDNKDTARSLAQVLTMQGHDVRIEHDGLAAVAAARTWRPEMILLDIGLPRLNGYEACREIRAATKGRNPVIVACTGWGQREDRERASEAGFDFHMVKPVDPGALDKLLSGLSSAVVL
ncbi:MAG TPA: PAS domain S-box protein [Casimicrobiaceae bacterium]|nr:PAS domain S-box protein [Casimicrobiaceae bacterium]